jgi:uncharacterized membrane protein YedE/YeeE
MCSPIVRGVAVGKLASYRCSPRIAEPRERIILAVQLILNGLTPMPWAVAGAAIGLITLALVLLGSRRLGISSGFEDLCGLALPRLRYFRRPDLARARPWRLPFVAGLVLGGFLSAVTSGGWTPTWAMGIFDEVIGFGPAGKVGWMFIGGLFIGFGTRLAGGCTSGHGIFGLSNFERPSLVATLCFMGGGLLTTQLVYHVIFR